MSSQVLDRPLILDQPEGALKDALDTAHIPSVISSDKWAKALDMKQKLLGQLDQLLPMETDAKAELTDQIAHYQVIIDQNQIRLPILSNEVFTWRDQEGLPLLVPFLPGKDSVTISGRQMRNTTNLPSSVVNYYRDVVELLSSRSSYSLRQFSDLSPMFMMLGLMISGFTMLLLSVTFPAVPNWVWVISSLSITVLCYGFYETPTYQITAKYSGTIPPQIRELIKTQSPHFDHIAVLVEVKDWVKNEVVRPRADPLVIAYMRSTDRWHLLAAYRTTPLEDLVQAEFTT